MREPWVDKDMAGDTGSDWEICTVCSTQWNEHRTGKIKTQVLISNLPLTVPVVVGKLRALLKVLHSMFGVKTIQ